MNVLDHLMGQQIITIHQHSTYKDHIVRIVCSRLFDCQRQLPQIH